MVNNCSYHSILVYSWDIGPISHPASLLCASDFFSTVIPRRIFVIGLIHILSLLTLAIWLSSINISTFVCTIIFTFFHFLFCLSHVLFNRFILFTFARADRLSRNDEEPERDTEAGSDAKRPSRLMLCNHA